MNLPMSWLDYPVVIQFRTSCYADDSQVDISPVEYLKSLESSVIDTINTRDIYETLDRHPVGQILRKAGHNIPRDILKITAKIGMPQEIPYAVEPGSFCDIWRQADIKSNEKNRNRKGWIAPCITITLKNASIVRGMRNLGLET